MGYDFPFERLYHISEWVKNLLFINILWMVFNLPNLYFIALLYIAADFNGFISIFIIIICLLPFTFFPATTAMFAVIRDLVIKNSQKGSIIRFFWKYYRKNYFLSLLYGIAITFVWVIFIVDYYFFTTHISSLFSYVFFILLFFLFVFTLNVFSVIVHFKSTFFQGLKNALLITIGSPFLTIGIGILNVLLIYVIFNYLTFLIPLFTGSAATLISFAGIYQLFLKIELRQFEQENKEQMLVH